MCDAYHVLSKWFHSEAFFLAKKCNLFCVWGPEVKKLSYSLSFKPLLKVTIKEVFRIVFPNQFYRYIAAKKDLPHSTSAVEGRNLGHIAKKHLYCRSYVPISMSCGSCQVGQQALLLLLLLPLLPPLPPPPPCLIERKKEEGRKDWDQVSRYHLVISLTGMLEKRGWGNNKPIFFAGTSG